MSLDPPPPAVHVWPLPYEEVLDQRPLEQIDLVVVHCTELPDMAMAREYGERVLHPSGAGNSGHYYIDRDGTVHLFVHAGRVANHTRGYNPRSIGIELVNIGRYPDWHDSRRQQMSEAYPDAQLDALVALLGSLQRFVPRLAFIAGHEDLDREQVAASDDPSLRIPRKLDPGPMFPWDAFLARTGLRRLRP